MKNAREYIFLEHTQRGVTLMDTLVGTALMLVIFLGIAAAFQLSVDVVTNNKARGSAIALANERMEYMRSVTYASLGTSGEFLPVPLRNRRRSSSMESLSRGAHSSHMPMTRKTAREPRTRFLPGPPRLPTTKSERSMSLGPHARGHGTSHSFRDSNLPQAWR